jgi:hypothetical protein
MREREKEVCEREAKVCKQEAKLNIAEDIEQ